MISFSKKGISEQGIFPDKAEKFKDSLPSYFLISAFHPVSPSGGLPVFPVSLREQRTGGTASDYVILLMCVPLALTTYTYFSISHPHLPDGSGYPARLFPEEI